MMRVCIIVAVAAALFVSCTSSPTAETVTVVARELEQPRPTAPTPSPTPQPLAEATPKPSATTSLVPSAEPTPSATESSAATITITVVNDNNAYRPSLETAWRFACLVETPSGTVLFDTGGDGAVLLANMAKLGVDTKAIDVIVLSHFHGDHVDELTASLNTGITPPVYEPAAFPAPLKARVHSGTELVEVSGPVDVLPGVRTTGEMGTEIVEQALVVESAEGLVVITGCAHPGVVTMVDRAIQNDTNQVALVVGGFHLGGSSRRDSRLWRLTWWPSASGRSDSATAVATWLRRSSPIRSAQIVICPECAGSPPCPRRRAEGIKAGHPGRARSANAPRPLAPEPARSPRSLAGGGGPTLRRED